MKHLVLYAANSNAEFMRQAKAYARRHGVPMADVIGIDCGLASRQRQRQLYDRFLGYTQSLAKFDVVAFFCHGWASRIQFGVAREDCKSLATWLSLCSGLTEPFRVILYACSTADDGDGVKGEAIGPATEGGFADALEDALVERHAYQPRVYAHDRAGHTTGNPYVVLFDRREIDRGGVWVVEPGSLYWSRWSAAMRDPSNPLRFDFPFLSESEIHERLIPNAKDFD